jgi:hypothetical protein
MADAERNRQQRRGIARDMAGESGPAQGEAHEWQRGGDAVGDSGAVVGNAKSQREREPTDEADAITIGGRTRHELGDPGGRQLADADKEREQRLPSGETAEDASSSSSSSNDGIPYWPPGPASRDEWQRILAERPDLAPATAESAIRGVVARTASGMGQPGTSRVDELRALGNAVVPTCGAVAFLILWQRLKTIMKDHHHAEPAQ